jgi:signal transduction histidine kinase
VPTAQNAGGESGTTVDTLLLERPSARAGAAGAQPRSTAHGETILYFRDVTRETEVDRMKSEFLTTAAHELRTPMVSVFGFTELLLNRPVPEDRDATCWRPSTAGVAADQHGQRTAGPGPHRGAPGQGHASARHCSWAA